VNFDIVLYIQKSPTTTHVDIVGVSQHSKAINVKVSKIKRCFKLHVHVSLIFITV